ncbi:MAG TPA: SemiSWEET transporter [Syntrophorhabdaceae bacterium]|nr:SemiSWEET transporter [Syntrophorhabdaceae bacterium]
MKNLIGYIAALFTTFSLMPQVIRVWRLKEARDVSIYMPVMISIGAVLWIVYGILIAETPIIVANGVSLIIGLITIYTTARYR